MSASPRESLVQPRAVFSAKVYSPGHFCFWAAWASGISGLQRQSRVWLAVGPCTVLGSCPHRFHLCLLGVMHVAIQAWCMWQCTAL